MDGKPAIYFETQYVGNDYPDVLLTYSGSMPMTEASIHYVYKPTITSGTYGILRVNFIPIQTGGSVNNFDYHSSGWITMFTKDNTRRQYTFNNPYNKTYVRSFHPPTSGSTMYFNNQAGQYLSNGNFYQAEGVIIGRSRTTYYGSLLGYIPELIIFPTSSQTYKDALDGNINAYYNIY